MYKKLRKKGRSDKESRHVRLYHTMLKTTAWKSLSANARAIYVEISARYGGPSSNNGRIPYSVRDAAKSLKIGKDTATRAFQQLQDRGFIVEVTKGGFNLKTKHATEWRLTEFSCDVNDALPTRAYERWPQIQNAVPVAGQYGTYSGTMNSLSWLRPFAITGAIVDVAPVGSTGARALAPNVTTGRLQSVPNPGVNTLQWGFSIQYSTYYLTNRFTGGPPKQEPLNQLVPLVEFSFDSPQGQHTAATMNPGFAYVAVTWQIAAEAIVPLNQAGGTGPGFRAQLLFFLDDLLPSVFGKPPLSDKPEVSQTAWH